MLDVTFNKHILQKKTIGFTHVPYKICILFDPKYSIWPLCTSGSDTCSPPPSSFLGSFAPSLGPASRDAPANSWCSPPPVTKLAKLLDAGNICATLQSIKHSNNKKTPGPKSLNKSAQENKVLQSNWDNWAIYWHHLAVHWSKSRVPVSTCAIVKRWYMGYGHLTIGNSYGTFTPICMGAMTIPKYKRENTFSNGGFSNGAGGFWKKWRIPSRHHGFQYQHGLIMTWMIWGYTHFGKPPNITHMAQRCPTMPNDAQPFLHLSIVLLFSEHFVLLALLWCELRWTAKWEFQELGVRRPDGKIWGLRLLFLANIQKYLYSYFYLKLKSRRLVISFLTYFHNKNQAGLKLIRRRCLARVRNLTLFTCLLAQTKTIR